MLTMFEINRKQVRRALKIRSIHHILWTKTKVWFLGNLRTSKRLELQIQPSHVNCGQATRHQLLPATAGRNTNWNFKRFKIRRGCLIIANTETEGTEPSSDPIVTIQRQSQHQEQGTGIRIVRTHRSNFLCVSSRFGTKNVLFSVTGFTLSIKYQQQNIWIILCSTALSRAAECR